MGAGASVAAGLPIAAALYDLVLARLRKNDFKNLGPLIAKVLEAAETFLKAAGSSDLEKRPNLEQILDLLSVIRTLPRHSLSDELRKLPAYDLTTLHSFVTKEVTQILLAYKDPAYLAGVSELLAVQDPLPVFTLNHDCCLEAAMSLARINCTTGIDNRGYWSQATFDRARRGLFLYKLHGSVDWLRAHRAEYPFCRASADDIMERLDEPCRVWSYADPSIQASAEYDTPVLHFGGRSKFVLEHPFTYFVDQLSRRLREARVIVLVGYGLMDRHINHLILESFQFGQKTLVQLNPSPFLPDNDQDRAVMIFSLLGARQSEWEMMQRQLLLYQNLKILNVLRPADHARAWVELRHAVRDAL